MFPKTSDVLLNDLDSKFTRRFLTNFRPLEKEATVANLERVVLRLFCLRA